MILSSNIDNVRFNFLIRKMKMGIQKDSMMLDINFVDANYLWQ